MTWIDLICSLLDPGMYAGASGVVTGDCIVPMKWCIQTGPRSCISWHTVHTLVYTGRFCTRCFLLQLWKRQSRCALLNIERSTSRIVRFVTLSMTIQPCVIVTACVCVQWQLEPLCTETQNVVWHSQYSCLRYVKTAVWTQNVRKLIKMYVLSCRYYISDRIRCAIAQWKKSKNLQLSLLESSTLLFCVAVKFRIFAIPV